MILSDVELTKTFEICLEFACEVVSGGVWRELCKGCVDSWVVRDMTGTIPCHVGVQIYLKTLCMPQPLMSTLLTIHM